MESESQAVKYELAYECALEESIECRKRLFEYSKTYQHTLFVSKFLWAIAFRCLCLVI